MSLPLTEAKLWLQRLVAHDTESSKTNLPLMREIEAYLNRCGVDYVTSRNASGDKQAIWAHIGPLQDGGIVLSGHTDVVPVAGQSWSSDPFTLREAEGRLYGRGTCDMKGFVAMALAMVPQFKAAQLNRPIHLLLTYDEETTCMGPVELIGRMGHSLPRPSAVIVGEPTGMQVADAHKGIATYETIVHGHDGHSSKPNLGANAIEIACDLVVELYRMNQDFAQLPKSQADLLFDPAQSLISVGKIEGGTARNILARRCSFSWEFRTLTGVSLSMAREKFDTFVDQVALPKLRRHIADCTIETITEVEIPCLTSRPDNWARHLAQQLTGSNCTIAVPFATEAGRFDTEGIATVVCGPGSIEQAHQPDEFIEISEMIAGLGFMQRLAQQLSI